MPNQAIIAMREFLQRPSFSLRDEVETQADIETYLANSAAAYLREHSLSGADRVDFFFPRSGIALEIKLRKNWSKEAIYRQLERYAGHDEVKAIVLATNIAMTLPSKINDKPAVVVKLREGI